MLHAVMLALALLQTADGQDDLLAKVERTELLINGKPAARIEKDEAGNVVRMQLDGMTLSAAEFAALARLTTIRHLSLCRTNVTAGDLRTLHTLARLEGLRLNSTELGDDAAGELVGFPALRSVCLGSVAIGPQAIERLKADFQSANRRLGLGYSQRKQ